MPPPWFIKPARAPQLSAVAKIEAWDNVRYGIQSDPRIVVTDKSKIAKVVNFLNERREGWYEPGSRPEFGAGLQFALKDHRGFTLGLFAVGNSGMIQVLSFGKKALLTRMTGDTNSDAVWLCRELVGIPLPHSECDYIVRYGTGRLIR